jgi:hypothetical protein
VSFDPDLVYSHDSTIFLLLVWAAVASAALCLASRIVRPTAAASLAVALLVILALLTGVLAFYAAWNWLVVWEWRLEPSPNLRPKIVDQDASRVAVAAWAASTILACVWIRRKARRRLRTGQAR